MAKTTKRRDADVITLGSGNLMIKEFTGTMPAYTEFDDEDDLLGRIKGGASLEYTQEWMDVEDDAGVVTKTTLVSEAAELKSGIITWNGKTIEKLCSTARLTESNGIRTIKIGGIKNNNGKQYAICFHHIDKTDGDVWIVVKAVNQNGFALNFAKDAETVIDSVFKCLSHDADGTLVQYIEEVTITPAS